MTKKNVQNKQINSEYDLSEMLFFINHVKNMRFLFVHLMVV